MTAAESRRCDCPACATRAAVHLLQTDRPRMALAVLRAVPDAYEAALAHAYERGMAAGRKAAARAKPLRPEPPAGGTAKPSFKRQAAELVGHVDRLGLTRTAALLGVTPGDMPGLLGGRCEAPKTGMARLRKAAADSKIPF